MKAAVYRWRISPVTIDFGFIRYAISSLSTSGVVLPSGDLSATSAAALVNDGIAAPSRPRYFDRNGA